MAPTAALPLQQVGAAVRVLRGPRVEARRVVLAPRFALGAQPRRRDSSGHSQGMVKYPNSRIFKVSAVIVRGNAVSTAAVLIPREQFAQIAPYYSAQALLYSTVPVCSSTTVPRVLYLSGSVWL